MRVWFTHAEGLTARDKEQDDFEIAGEDHNFVHATASVQKMDGADTVLVQSESVPFPKYVRYGWSGVVKSYLYNAAGLPVGTFTSEY